MMIFSVPLLYVFLHKIQGSIISNHNTFKALRFQSLSIPSQQKVSFHKFSIAKTKIMK